MHSLVQHLVSDINLPGKLAFYDRVLKSKGCMALASKAADKTGIREFLNPSE
jgi:hypothetical protein